jgi:hypothetical protein
MKNFFKYGPLDISSLNHDCHKIIYHFSKDKTNLNNFYLINGFTNSYFSFLGINYLIKIL